jgi:hypothetical protein
VKAWRLWARVCAPESLWGLLVDRPAGWEGGTIEMNPQEYAQRTPYRPPASWYRRLNWVGVALTSPSSSMPSPPRRSPNSPRPEPPTTILSYTTNRDLTEGSPSCAAGSSSTAEAV